MTAETLNNDNIKLVGEQQDSIIQNDRVQIGTIRDMTREGPKAVRDTIKANTIEDHPERLLGIWVDCGTIPLVSSSSFSYTEYDWFGNVFSALSTHFNQTWKFWKCDMEISLQLNGSPLDYGWIGFSWNPSSLVPISTPVVFDPVNSHLHEIDITTGGTHMVTVPYSNICEAYDVTSNNARIAPARPRFYLTFGLMGTLAQTFSSTLTVKARFVNISTFGVSPLNNSLLFYEPYTVPNGLTHRTYGEKRIKEYKGHFQMNEAGNAATAGGVLLTGATVMYQMYTGVVETTQMVDDVSKTITKATETYEKVEGAFSKGKTLFRDRNIKPASKKDMLEAKAQNDQTLNMPTFMGSMSSLDYRPSNENLSYGIHDLPPHHLYDWAPKNLREIAQIPCLYKQVDLVQGGTFYVDACPFYALALADYTSNRPDYLMQVADLFRYWRGSVDYSFHFHTSSLISGRILFEVINFGEGNPDTSPGTLPKTFSYKRTEVIGGYTVINLRIPFILNVAWASNNVDYGVLEDFRFGTHPSRLWITCENLSSGLAGSGANPHVFCTVHRSGGPDIQFRNLVGSFLTNFPVVPPANRKKKEEETKGRFQMSEKNIGICEVQKNKPANFVNICMGSSVDIMYRYTPEDDFNVYDYSQRWCHTNLAISDGSVSLPNSEWSLLHTSYPVGIFQRLMNWHRYVRGNVRFRSLLLGDTREFDSVWVKMVGDVAFRTSNTRVYDTLASDMGIAYCVPVHNPAMEYEAPIEAETEWVCTPDSLLRFVDSSPTLSMIYEAPGQTIGPDSFTHYCCMGRGYGVAYLQPPYASFDTFVRLYNY